MKRRAKPQKRVRQKVRRLLHRNRLTPAMRFDLEVKQGLPWRVEVRLGYDKRRMHDAMRCCEGERHQWDPRCEGQVTHWWHGNLKRAKTYERHLIARMYLNVRDLRNRPNEIIAHECTHAAMAWCRVALPSVHSLARMEGEEVLAYAAGHLNRQLTWHLYARRVFPR